MRVKRYLVDTMPEAMLQIRNDLGSDAVILSTKETKIGGFLGMFRQKKIEVVAAVEQEDKAKPDKPPVSAARPAAAVLPKAVPQAYKKTLEVTSSGLNSASGAASGQAAAAERVQPNINPETMPEAEGSIDSGRFEELMLEAQNVGGMALSAENRGGIGHCA